MPDIEVVVPSPTVVSVINDVTRLDVTQIAGSTISISTAGIQGGTGPQGTITSPVTSPISFESSAVGIIPVRIKGFAGQTGDMTQWQNSASIVLLKVKPNGELESTVNSLAATDALGGTGGVVLKSPDGTRYRITVANGGALTVTAA